MGSAESLQQCISEAESGAEAEECVTDYDELVTPKPKGGPTPTAMAGIAVVFLLGTSTFLMSQ